MFAATLRITKITYEGCENTSGEEIEKYFFEKDIDKNPFLFFFHSHFQEHEEIPFVEEYEVDMVSLTEFKVTVYEKSIIGYLKYMGQCMYFDKDGIVVETTSKELEGIVPVEGIDFDHIVVNEKIPVDNEETFDTILAVTQLIHNYQIAVDKIDISKELEITLYISQVRVELGKKQRRAEWKN
jgi:cell division protein FtsQ